MELGFQRQNKSAHPYIFPLLFFKRLSDLYDEEYAVALEESDGDVEFARFPENHRFRVPEGCHWKDVRAKSANIGHALQKALHCIEQANPDTLHGIFGDAQWTNKDRMLRERSSISARKRFRSPTARRMSWAWATSF